MTVRSPERDPGLPTTATADVVPDEAGGVGRSVIDTVRVRHADGYAFRVMAISTGASARSTATDPE